MDVHRCRFVPYPPSAINAIAFSHESTPDSAGRGPPTLRLAIGRANGDIEIWNPQGGDWYQESILRGGTSRSIEGLVWTHDPEDEDVNGHKLPGKLRLFSIGYSTEVTEWDLGLGRPVRHCTSNYGEIWCMAASPRLVPNLSKDTARELRMQKIVVGCADGTLALLGTGDEELRFLRPLGRSTKRKARVLCVAFLTHDLVVAGYADSTIRVYSTTKGQQVAQMTLGGGVADKKEKGNTSSEILVWCLRVLPDRTIVSGDSTGTISFWDGKNFTLLQRLQSHKADILDLVANGDGTSVISGGMDRRTTLYRRNVRLGKNIATRWAEITHRRFHTHDVKAIAVFETREFSVVASGGLDTTPIIVPFREFGRENARTLTHLPQSSQVHSAPSKRLVVSWWERELHIWRIGAMPREDENDGPEDVDSRTRRRVGKIYLKGEESIATASLDPSGTLLAIATISETKVFMLRKSRTPSSDVLRVQQLGLPEDVQARGARRVQFSPDSKWLAVVDDKDTLYLYCFQILDGKAMINSKITHLRKKSKGQEMRKPRHGTHGSYEHHIQSLAFSSDSRILIAGSLDGSLDSWVLEGNEDLLEIDLPLTNGHTSMRSDEDDDSSDEESSPSATVFGQHWARNPSGNLPRLPSAPLVLSFRPTSTNSTCNGSTLSTANGNIGLHATRHNPHPQSHSLPKGEDRLIAVTSQHQIYEYHVLSGRFSEWTRRNPSRNFPVEFRRIMDRTMDCLWDISHPHNEDKARERLWLYGPSWLCMFDLAQDFPLPDEDPETEEGEESERAVGENDAKENAQNNRKRKRPGVDEPTMPVPGSGAGSKMQRSRLGEDDRFRLQHGLDETSVTVVRASDRRAGPSIPKSANNADDDDEDGEDGAKQDNSGANEAMMDSEVADLRSAKKVADMSASDLALARLRRPPMRDVHRGTDGGDVAGGGVANGHADEDSVSSGEDDAEGVESTGRRRGARGDTRGGEKGRGKRRGKGRVFWHTHKYRPILGIVPLERGDDDSEVEVEAVEDDEAHDKDEEAEGMDGIEGADAETGGDLTKEAGRALTSAKTAGGGASLRRLMGGIEVMLVERPLWNVQLPPRFVGDQEWNAAR
ncbi:U3 small nucleolar RNA-associated protein [Agyrium rufum]|nr:U3 small nucleolar RNA-associated protein [Agyrium rufum]